MPQPHTAKKHQPMVPPDDAIAMLHAAHRQVLQLFQHFDTTSDPALQQRIAEDVFAALALLGQLEETVFYPAFAEAAGEDGDRLVGGARQEHQLFKDLVAELRDLDDEDVFPAHFHELRDYVAQHVVVDEEREMFPLAAASLGGTMAQLTDAMHALTHQRGAA
jgi:Hemerythrin HHE cation binding domain